MENLLYRHPFHSTRIYQIW